MEWEGRGLIPPPFWKAGSLNSRYQCGRLPPIIGVARKEPPSLQRPLRGTLATPTHHGISRRVDKTCRPPSCRVSARILVRGRRSGTEACEALWYRLSGGF